MPQPEDTLTDVDRADLLFPGLPVFGPGMAEGVMIQSVDVEAWTVTLSGAGQVEALRSISVPGF
jgi:hypothetical protein